jgi:hypothetical protein
MGVKMGMRRGMMISAGVGPRAVGVLVVLAAMCSCVSAATLTITAAAASVAYAEQAAATAVDAGLTIGSDADDATAVTASVKLTTTDSNDVLEFGTAPWYPTSYEPYSSATGLMTITGLSSFKAYQVWLRDVTFKNTNDRPNSGTRTAEFKVCKTAGDCVTATKTINFSPVNDKPVFTLSPAFSYTEMTGKVYVDSALALADPDTDTLSRATVQISAGYDNGKDVLTCAVDPATLKDAGGASYGLSQSWDAATGTMTVTTSGTAPLSVWAQVLQGVQYENPSQNPAPGNRAFAFKAYDGTDWSAATTRAMTFVIINEIPVITLSNTALTYAEQDVPAAVKYLVVDAGLAVADVDTPLMASATVKVAVGHEPTKDFLRFTATGAITGSFDAASGTLTMTGSASALAYQAVLRTVQYYNAAANAAAGTRQIEFKVTDGEGGTSAAANVGVTFAPENDAPEMFVVTTPVEWIRQTVNLQPTLTLMDKDDVTLASASVTIVQGQGFDPTVDSLTATKVAGVHDAIEVKYDAGTGVLLLSGPGSPAVYQSLLRTVNLVQTDGAAVSCALASPPIRCTSRQLKFEAKDLAGATTGAFYRRYHNSDLLKKPTITSITTVGTTGGQITIQGAGFGPVDPNLVKLVGLASRDGFVYCTNVVVTVEDTTIVCDAPGGSGANLGAFVQIALKYSNNFNVFNYFAPTVSAIGSIGTLGGTVTITGTNFGLAGASELTAAANGDSGLFGVTIGTLECANAQVVGDTGTKITCTAAEYVGKDLDVKVCVTKQCNTNSGLFDYTAPTITGSFKASVFGYYAYITGTNFGPVGTPSYITATFQATTGGNSFTCSTTEVTVASTQIKCMMPAMQNAAAANTNDPSKTYKVTLNVGTGVNLQQFVGNGIFTYEKPVITSVTTASFYGGKVTVTGRNFGGVGAAVPTLQARDPANGNTFDVGAAACSVAQTSGCTPIGQDAPVVTALNTVDMATDANQASIATTWISPYTNYNLNNNAYGVGTLTTMTPEIYITIGGFKSAVAFTGFTYEGPIITGMESSGGSQFGDCITATNAVPCTERITITGRNFGPIVDFTAWWLSHLNGKKDVTETISPLFSNKYARVEIDGKLPCGSADCTVRNNWGLAAQANTGTSIQEIQVLSATKMSFTRTSARPEAHLTGASKDIKVYLYCHGTTLATCQHSGTTGAGIFNYIGPSVTGFMPVASAPNSAGGTVTITGIRFGAPYAANAGFFNKATYASAGVEICSRTSSCDNKVYCTNPAVLNDTAVTCLANAATLTTGISMKTQIKVTLGAKDSGTTGAGLFTYGGPTVSAGLTSPAIGGQLTITGTGFGPAGYHNYLHVSVGPLARVCTNVVVVSHTTITCTQSPGTGALIDVNVTITSMDGDALGSAAGNKAFSYSLPTVTSVTSCLTSGGTVGVYGTNFGNINRDGGTADSVDIVGNTLKTIKIYNDTYLEGVFDGAGPFASAPPHTVQVTIDAQTSLSTGNFYFTSPIITGIAKRPSWIGSDTVQLTGTSLGAAGTSVAAGSLVVTVSGGDITLSACQVSLPHTQITCSTSCATACKTVQTGTTHLNYRDVAVQVGLAIAAGNANAGTRLNSGTTGSGKLKLVGPVITQAIGATSATANKLSFFPASDNLMITGLNFGKIDASDGSTLEFIGVCSKTLAACAPFPFIIAANNYGDFGTPTTTPTKTIDNTQLQTTLTARYGTDYSVMVKIAGVTSDDAENIDAAGTGKAVTDAVGNGLLDFIGPAINDVAFGHGILTDGTQGMTAKTQVAVSGLRFGPTGTTNIREIRWNNFTVSGKSCTDGCYISNSNAVVSVLDTQLKFDIPEGVGTATFTIVLNNAIGDMTSASATFAYTTPAITAVSVVAAGGGTLTITGTSFGPAGNTYLTELLVGTVACTSAIITVAHKQIKCTLPPGTGSGQDVSFKIGGLAATNGTGTFSYSQPSLTSVATMLTNQKIAPNAINNASYPSIGEAPWMVLTGTHFGPLGTVYEYIRLGSDLSGTHSVADAGYTNCTNIQVTVADTEMQCLLGSKTLGSGSGMKYDVLIKLPGGPNNGPGNGSNTYADKFTYAIPTVTTTTSVTYFGGVTTTITGTNFGCDSSSYASNACVLPTGNDQTVSVTIGGKTCTSPNVTVAHTQITCVTPAMTGSGVAFEDIALVVTVEGQGSVGSKYTYDGPLITTISEASTFGGWVTITGTSFGPLTDCSNGAACNIEKIWINGNSVVVSSVKAKVSKAGTEMQFYAPANPLINVAVNLTLTIAGKETGTSGHLKFTYRGPIVDAVVGGPTSGGTAVITGRNFGPVGNAFQSTVQKFIIRGDNKVEEACLDAKVTIENVQITCTSPGGSGTKKDVLITIAGAPANSPAIGYGLFNYQPAEVTSGDPDFGKEGTVVTFTGTSFGADVTKITAYVDDIGCTGITLVQPHYKISCTIPKSSGGLRPVRVDVDGVVGTPKPVYSYALPQVTLIQATLPSKGSPPPVTIYGLNFGGLYSVLAGVNDTQSPQIENVTVGSALCSLPRVIVDDKVITCNVPKALATDYGGSFKLTDWDHTAGGNMSIKINLVGDQTSGSTGNNKFAFNEPTVTAIQPPNGKMGDVIVISGTDLGDSGAAVQVYINGRLSPQADFISAESSFKFVVPVGTSINNEVIIKINGRNATYSGVPALFHYDIPVLDPAGTVPPSTTRGGAVTTLKGTGFGPVGNAYLTSVQIEGVGACLNPNVTVEDTELICTTNSGQGGGINTTVTVDGLTSLLTPAFSFHVPIVTSVQIQNNETFLRKGDILYIRGSNFGNDASKITVRIKGDLDTPGFGVVCPLSGEKLTFLTHPNEMVTCIAPLTVGKKLSVIVDAAGLENVNADDLNKVTYPNPVVYTVSSAKTSGGEAAGMVTITGTNFGPAGAIYSQYFTSILLGTVPCNTPVVTETNNKLECAPAGGVGTGLDVVVTMNNAGSGTSGAGKFSFYPPKVVNIDPPPTIGGPVTVYGENFGPAGTFATATVYTDQTCVTGITPSSFMGATGCTPIEGVGKPTQVTVIDHGTITFNFPAGVGGSYDLLIELGNQTSGVSGDNKFGYHVPVVQTVVPMIQPATLPISDTKITITGTNFGTMESAVKVSIGGKYSDVSSIRLFNFRNPQTGAVTGVSEIYVNIPFNAGNNLPVQVHVGAMSSVPSTADVKPDVFSYNTPVVNYTTPVPTEGSAESNVPMSIHGWNFGAVGNISEVRVGNVLCTEPKVVTIDRVITCQQPAGMGKDLDVFVKISPTDDTSSQSTGVKKFSYAAPVITDLTPKSAKVGEYVTVTGKNFGLAQDQIRLCVVGPNDVNWCNEYNEMQKMHTKFNAKVPVGYGSNRALRVEVKGLMGVKTTGILFTYKGPQVNSALDVSTAGGVLRVIGKEFGPKNSAAFDSVTVRDSRQRLVPCLAPHVVVDDTAVECDLPAGSGKGLEVQVSVGGQESSWERVFSYAAPLITNIEPAVAAAGETVTVTGLNFGVEASEITLGLEKDIAGGGGKYYINITSATASITMIASHTKFSFVVPLGAGPELTLLTSLPKYGYDETFLRTSTSAPSTSSSSTTFSYKAPVISAVSSVSTAGGVATITGTNFGPVGSGLVNSVVMGEGATTLVCGDAKVTVANTQATCDLGSGSGPSYKTTMVIFNQTNVDDTRFSYSLPVIDSVQPSEAKPGDVVTVTGKNFGVTVTDVSIKLGTYECKDVAKLADHTRLTCTVPAAEGKAQLPVATVKGLSGSIVTAAQFTFIKSGCFLEEAVNYDVNATKDEGTCKVRGCPNPEAFNYVADKIDTKATNITYAIENDGTCEEMPVIVTMRIQADYSDYVAKPQVYEDQFKDDMGKNLNISRSRIQILNVTAGSIVFTFKILDDGYGGIRVAEASKKLETMVLDNVWESDFVLLEMQVEGSTTGPIVTKASEPAISMKSMIGVGVGFGILVVWLFLWRRCMTTVATRCFAAKDDEEDGLVEVQVYENPIAQEKLPSAYAKYGKLGPAY